MRRRTSMVLVALALVVAAPAAAQQGQTFTVAWGGDVTPGSSFGLPPADGTGMLAAVGDQLQAADVAAVNLEGTLGNVGSSKCAGPSGGDCFAFQAPPANARAFSMHGVDLVNVANNHHFDFGAPGAAATLQALQAEGVAWAGRRGQITFLDLPRARVAAVGFAAYGWASPIRDLGFARTLVQQAAASADVVLVFLHGGAEGGAQTRTPDRDETAFGELRGNTRAFAHTAIDAGADLVLGSGPHVLRGLELYQGRLIAYSLGNLAGWRTYGRGGASTLSGLLVTRLAPDGAFAAGRFTSLRLDGPGVPVPDPADAAAQLVTRVSRLDFGSRGVRIAPSGDLVP